MGVNRLNEIKKNKGTRVYLLARCAISCASLKMEKIYYHLGD